MRNIRPTTKEAIIEAAFDVFGRDPSASLNEVATAASVGRATLHRHFAGRDDLVLALAKQATQELDQAVEKAVQGAESWTASLRLSLAAIIPLANRQWFLAQESLEHHPEIADAYAKQRAELIEAIEEAAKEGAFAPDVPSSWIAAAYDSLIYAAWESVRAEELTATQAADFAWRTLTQGLNGDVK